MFTESQILVAALLRLIDRGIPALPMDDNDAVVSPKAGAAMTQWRQPPGKSPA